MAVNYKINKVDNEFFLQANSDLRKRIVDLGCAVLENVLDKNPITLSKYNKQIEESREFFNNLNLERTERINDLTLLNKYLTEENEALKNKHLCTNTKKGQIGEQSIDDYISNTFTDCELCNTTKTTAAGDLQLIIDKYNLLLESKNKTVITKEDISKFKRDIKETESSAGVFVCIKDVTIPLKGCFGFELVDNRPLFYMSNFENTPELLKLCIQMCISICKKINTKPSDIELKYRTVVDMCNELLPVIKTCKSNQEKSMKDIKQILKILENQIESF